MYQYHYAFVLSINSCISLSYPHDVHYGSQIIIIIDCSPVLETTYYFICARSTSARWPRRIRVILNLRRLLGGQYGAIKDCFVVAYQFGCWSWWRLWIMPTNNCWRRRSRCWKRTCIWPSKPWGIFRCFPIFRTRLVCRFGGTWSTNTVFWGFTSCWALLVRAGALRPAA